VAQKKRYLIGMGLLVLGCLLMPLFAKSAENLQLLHHVLEFLGLYDGYLVSTRNVVIWIVLAVAIFVLISLAFKLMWRAQDGSAVKKRYKAIPVGVLLVSVIGCLLSVHMHRLILQIPGGLNTVILNQRDVVFYAWMRSENEIGGAVNLIGLYINFQKYSPEDKQFFVKLVDLDDSANESIVSDSPIRFHGEVDAVTYTCNFVRHFVEIENVPGYRKELNNSYDLRFKVVIFNEKESKSFYLYFDTQRDAARRNLDEQECQELVESTDSKSCPPPGERAAVYALTCPRICSEMPKRNAGYCFARPRYASRTLLLPSSSCPVPESDSVPVSST